jgi:hypothetical protein
MLKRFQERRFLFFRHDGQRAIGVKCVKLTATGFLAMCPTRISGTVRGMVTVRPIPGAWMFKGAADDVLVQWGTCPPRTVSSPSGLSNLLKPMARLKGGKKRCSPKPAGKFPPANW